MYRGADGDVPLGEDTEAYLLRVSQNGAVKREVTLSSPSRTYNAASLAADVGTGGFDVAVVQISGLFGAGPFATVHIAS